jgi:enhancing lycopene biosynthesis protein 2
VGVLLAGCGVYDGSDVQETVLVLLALRRLGLRVLFLAPDIEQRDVADHGTGNVVEEAPARRVLAEAARLARGVVQSLSEVAPEELDALVIPGGVGVLKNLCVAGSGLFGDGPPLPEVASYLDRLRARSVPIAAIGLAEAVLARHEGRTLSEAPIGMPATEVVVDPERKSLFTPGFMGSSDVVEVAAGIERLADELARMIGITPGLRVREGSRG